jgi:hypothetical protein
VEGSLHPGGTVGSVGVNYLPVNAAPVVDELVVVTGARINPQTFAQNQPGGTPPTVNIAFPSSSQNTITFDGTSLSTLQAIKDRTAITVRWAAHDDNGDDLIYSLYLRGDGESVWRLLKDQVTDKAYSFDATLIPDGGYQIKVVASDSPSHTPVDALTGDKISERFEVDTTPPVVSGLKATAEAGSRVTFEAEDAFSPSPMPNTRSTPAHGSSSTPSANSLTRSRSTTIFTCLQSPSKTNPASTSSPSASTTATTT